MAYNFNRFENREVRISSKKYVLNILIISLISDSAKTVNENI